jgi:HAD superfamily hydrolase (TIGR01484 family)
LVANSNPIRLIVLDIDGVLTAGEAAALDLPLLERLARMNRKARLDPSRPAVTLCTGRPAPYVEVMLQAIDGHLPAVFENGAGLYLPASYEFLPCPGLGDGSQFIAAQQHLADTLVQGGRAFFQPGKQFSLSLFATDAADTARLFEWTTAALGPLRQAVDLVYSISCLNVLPKGVDKGKGIEFLAKRAGYTPAEMLGVGDSEVDLPFLASVGYSAAPSNAIPEVKALVQYVAARPTADGVRDILNHFALFRASSH